MHIVADKYNRLSALDLKQYLKEKILPVEYLLIKYVQKFFNKNKFLNFNRFN